MPAYRAESTLERTVADIPPGVADRLILVDDASPDNTAELARGLGIDVHVHVENLGYGGNQKTCYTEALRSGADIVVLLHPDYQYEPKAVPLLIAPIIAGDADMTFGSRFAGLGDPIGGGMPVYRFMGNRVTTILENLMLGSRFSELHSGLRAYTRRCLLSLPFLGYSDDFVFDSQLLVDAVTLGQRVVEVPIPTRYTKESSSIAIGRSLTYILESLSYCASRAATRGRRGRRSPVAHPERLLPPVDASDADHGNGLREPERYSAPPAAEQLLEAAGSFVVSGDRLLVIGPDEHELVELARRKGWQAIMSTHAGGAPPNQRPAPPAGQRTVARTRKRDAVDGVIVRKLAERRSEALAELRGARSRLDVEGILVIGAAAAQSAHAALTRTGFRMVDWIPDARRGGPHTRVRMRSRGSGIAVARPAEPAPRRAT
jgi:hypothetical protein